MENTFIDNKKMVVPASILLIILGVRDIVRGIEESYFFEVVWGSVLACVFVTLLIILFKTGKVNKLVLAISFFLTSILSIIRILTINNANEAYKTSIVITSIVLALLFLSVSITAFIRWRKEQAYI